ncbi:MAG TPA: isochorismatase family protein [Chloroflexia bacterium]|nr:isochorismatase family protein [Chloroflexia bacterium]
MPVTTLDPKTALVVIDLQNGMKLIPAAHSVQDVIDRAAKLAAAFREYHLPVVLVNVKGGAPGRVDAKRPAQTPPPDWADLVPELDAQPGDITITKYRWGAFHDTTLHQQLQALGVTQIVLAGISTSIGVETTARAAYEHGYNVTLVIDAMTDANAEAHQNSIKNIFPRLGETGTTQEVLDALNASR